MILEVNVALPVVHTLVTKSVTFLAGEQLVQLIASVVETDDQK
jgi:hypothetical protein